MAGLGFKDFQVGEVLTSSDVDGYLMQQTVMRFADSGARGSALGTAPGTAVALAEGMVTYLDDANRLEFYDGSAWRQSGRVLQIVTATDTTDRSTTSGSFTDAGISVSVTPFSAASTLIVTWVFSGRALTSGNISNAATAQYQITDSSDTALEGAEAAQLGAQFTGLGTSQFLSAWVHTTVVGYVSSGSTSARTYKGRYRRVSASNAYINNATNTGRLIVMEVE